MYSFIGLESACVSSALIKNYKKHVPTATITGVIITATLYIIASTIIMGIVPYNQLIISNAPFTLALQKNLGKNTILLIDICIIISCFNALCGWTMVTSQMIKDGAKDNIFPAIFAKGNYNDIPTYGLILITISTIFIVFLTTRPTINQQFAVVLDVSVLLYLIVYFYSCASYFIIGIKKLSIKSYLFYGILSLISLTFCLISFLDTEFTMLILAIAITSSSTFFYLFRFIR
jgi:arginine:agmatine antiporter